MSTRLKSGNEAGRERREPESEQGDTIMLKALKKNVATILVVLGVLFVLGTQTGCNELLGYYGGYYFPSYGYYDPYYDIQSVIGYRQDVMDNAATAWDQYITGDYTGGDNDDWSTPDYWASGPEW
jgi:hypothetical protein